ncbi:defensin-like protein 285 [Arabidopsis lyrata subsp. lyrata]|uniref:defensin-like protein 285 n=1 Tax=Arabidopsis lyrata subsp. lyrata TaxID=81972 RepID=UPI000A29E586|nr:defensin-like protein 285 [Arabidopsis lyrata subsp. lyrata]|eukprot:XP_020871069.1 defensin-like protein 285 [Arabidopsis lyrata subsp. lyrata]
MTNLYFKTAFLLSLLLSFSYQSKIIDAKEDNGSPTNPSPSMIDLEEGNTKTIDVNHGGICDTYLECGKMLCSDYRRACCVNGKCICRKPGQNVPNCPN